MRQIDQLSPGAQEMGQAGSKDLGHVFLRVPDCPSYQLMLATALDLIMIA